MHWKRKIVALAGALVLATGFNAPVLAQTNTDTVTATLNAGFITVSIVVTDDLDSQSFSHSGYTDGVGGAFTVVVRDDRATAAGFSVNIAASDFTNGSGGTITLQGLDRTGTLTVPTPGVVTTTAGDSSKPPTANTAPGLSTTAVAILTAAPTFGNGHYSAAGYGLALTGVASSVRAGTYTSTLTVSTSNAPS